MIIKPLMAITALSLLSLTANASDAPQKNAWEIDFGGHYSNQYSNKHLSAFASAGWYITNSHEVGAKLSHSHDEIAYTQGKYTVDYTGSGLFYHFNWVDPSRNFFPYAGVSYNYNRSRTTDRNEFQSGTYKGHTDYWQPITGLKIMLNKHVAFDVNITRTLWANNDYGLKDYTDVNAGLAFFL